VIAAVFAQVLLREPSFEQ